MPVELIRLVTPMASLVDRQLGEEVRNLDKSKRKKRVRRKRRWKEIIIVQRMCESESNIH